MSRLDAPPLVIPSRVSDAGDDQPEQPLTFSTLLDFAVDEILKAQKARREALVNTTRTAWLKHVRRAVELLDEAETQEINQ